MVLSLRFVIHIISTRPPGIRPRHVAVTKAVADRTMPAETRGVRNLRTAEGKLASKIDAGPKNVHVRSPSQMWDILAPAISHYRAFGMASAVLQSFFEVFSLSHY